MRVAAQLGIALIFTLSAEGPARAATPDWFTKTRSTPQRVAATGKGETTLEALLIALGNLTREAQPAKLGQSVLQLGPIEVATGANATEQGKHFGVSVQVRESHRSLGAQYRADEVAGLERPRAVVKLEWTAENLHLADFIEELKRAGVTLRLQTTDREAHILLTLPRPRP